MIITEKETDKKILEDKGQFRQLVLTETEFSSLLKSTKEVRYKYTIKRIVDTETIWLLSSTNDSILSLSHDKETFIPIWSSKDYGINYCKKFEVAYNCRPVSLYDFLDFIMKCDSEDNFKISIFPTLKDIMGMLVNIEEFIHSVDEEQEWY